MPRKTKISVILVLCVFLTPFAALTQSQITLQPIYTMQPIITPLPPEYTVLPETFTFEPGTGAFASVTPQIDGAISSGYTYAGTEVPGEWDDAVKIDFELSYTNEAETHNATLYIKNDFINIYMALVVRKEEYNSNDLVHFNFDNNNNGALDAGEDQLALFGGSNLFRDLYYPGESGSSWDPVQNGVGAAKWYPPFLVATQIYTVQPVEFVQLAQPLTTASSKAEQIVQPIYSPIQTLEPITTFPLQPITTLPLTSIQPIITEMEPYVQPILTPPITYTPLPPISPVPEPPQGTWVFEVAHPLNSADNAHDINANIGDTIGLSVAYWDMEEEGGGGAGGYPSFFNWADMFEYRIAGPLVMAATHDITIDWIEVTQAIQDTSNSLPLAKGKTTVARAYLDIGPGGGPVHANVFLYATDPDTMSTLPGPLVASVFAPSSPQRTQITHSANFLLPNSWVSRTHLELRAFITSTTAETNFNNNWLVSQQQTFHKTRVLNVYEIPFNTGTEAAPNTVSDALITSNEEAMLKTYPVERINFIRLDWTAAGGPFTGNYDQRIAKLNEIAGQLILGWILAFLFTGEEPDFPLPDQIYGYYTSGGGISDPTWYEDGQGIAATGYIGSSRELTMAHEVNHNLDKSSTGTWGRHAPYGCGATGPDPSWPYTNDDINEIGCDVTVWPPEVLPTTYPDFMSYCQGGLTNTKWISEYRWTELFEYLEESPYYPAAEASAKSAGLGKDAQITLQPVRKVFEPRKVLQVSGWVEREPVAGALESIVMVDAPPKELLSEMVLQYSWLSGIVGNVILDEPRPVPIAKQPDDVLTYELVALDAAGTVLSSESYLASFFDVHANERERVHFTRYIQLPEGLRTAGAMIQLRVGRQILDTKTMSLNAPVVRVTTPVGGEKWAIGTRQKVSWEAHDPDGDQLIFTVQYSNDGGNFWMPLASGLKKTSLEVDPARIPGTGRAGGFVRVLASEVNGFHTGEGQNEKPFYVQRKAPIVKIVSPAMGQSFGTRDIIPLKGHGYDLEDGELPDYALRWDFEGGHLGNGSTLDVVRLGPGEHVITLTGTDSDGLTGMARIKILIGVEEIVPVLLEVPLVRAGAGMAVKADVSPSNVAPGESAVLYVAVHNGALEPAEGVELMVNLPPELKFVSGEPHVSWKEIPSGETVEMKFEVAGEEKGLYEIGIEVKSVNLRPAVAQVYLGIEAVEVPVLVETTIVVTEVKTEEPPEKTTTPEETLPEVTTSPEEKIEEVTETVTKTEVTPGFEVIPVLLAIPFLLWFRRRRRRR